ncbi:Response regulator [Rhodovastum atsumiense]|uniref:Response regulator n=1 Tax=Rhodovastum atsumiense TaxID=504468 RepID=A0A5M6ITX6_9PROT|nr:response regulator [Rhodovastum atsumiense]KAA5611712.1 response regulator [Rhodovastum atsumiense]CAH2604289.1 Response regulator [Rhodovastum atsumiense]
MNALPDLPQPVPRILVVDDEVEVREILAETLEDFGYSVMTAGNGEEALSVVLREHGVGLVITDVRMPGMTGLELADQIRHRRPDVKVVLISGYFLPQAVPQRFLKKPFHMKDLAAIVRAELG